MCSWRCIDRSAGRRPGLLLVIIALVLSACSNTAPNREQASAPAPTTEAASLPSLPIGTLIGERCVAETCVVADARPVEIGGATYVATRKIGYDKLGDPIAEPVGSDVETVEIRAINGRNPQAALAVTGDGLNAVRYIQVERLARTGPAIVRLNPDDPEGYVDQIEGALTLEAGCLYLSAEHPVRTQSGFSRLWPETTTALVLWPAGTVWHDAPRSEVELTDGTVISLGDLVRGVGRGGAIDQLTEQHGQEQLAGCLTTTTEFVRLYLLAIAVTDPEFPRTN